VVASTRNFAYGSNYTSDGDGPFRTVPFSTDTVLVFPGGKTGLTVEGGIAMKFTNKTGAPSVKGTLVGASGGSVDNAVELTTADSINPIGAIYEDGIADAADVWVVVGGIVQVKLAANEGSTRGYWMRTSVTAAGRADALNASPPNQTVHFQEIGHCLETVAGTAGGSLCKIVMHFN
jgi:hypothetical protein